MHGEIALQLERDGWGTMDTAPKDRPITVLTDSANGLPPIICRQVKWHEEAGFTVCELRNALLWREQ